ncbi:MAG: divergent polysaccharide deacetylase family protein [Alphaproteobacteria bacterium]
MKNFFHDLLEIFYEIRETFADFDRKQWALTYIFGLIFVAIIVFSVKTEPPVPLNILQEQTIEQQTLYEAIQIPQVQIEEGGRPDVRATPIKKEVITLPTPEPVIKRLPLRKRPAARRPTVKKQPVKPQTPPAPKKVVTPIQPLPRGEKYKIAIVIDDVGLSRKRTEEAIALPNEINLSFLPYGSNVEELVNQAFEEGHEIWVHIPMESRLDTVDSGRGTLAVNLPPYEIHHRLDWNLSQFGHYVGINNHMGSLFTTHTDGMRLVMGELKKRHLLFLDSRTTTETVGAREALRAGVPHTSRNIFLDNLDDLAAIQEQLIKTENYAIKHGVAIAIGHPRKNTLEALALWAKDLNKSHFKLMRLSALIRARYE